MFQEVTSSRRMLVFDMLHSTSESHGSALVAVGLKQGEITSNEPKVLLI